MSAAGPLRGKLLPMRVIGSGIAAVLAFIAGGVALDRLDRAYPPPVGTALVYSPEVVDREGTLLRAYSAPDGRWRLKPDLSTIDADYIRMLIAYEDKRFYSHSGVDMLAMARAFGQAVVHRRIVSGGSTLTMQVARLIEPRAERSLTAKVRQMARALQIERRFSKQEILTLYLTLAPYGGNLEGVRAASLAWFGREPKKLLLSEAAMLVALPQAPESRRPDRDRGAAKRARDRVLARLASEGVFPQSEVQRAARAAVPALRREMPALAAHAADRMRAAHPDALQVATSLDAGVQSRIEALAREAASQLPAPVSLAVIVADARSGAILASAGSPDFLDPRRQGAIDMTQAVRSPGSALKPFIYALAFEDGIAEPATLIDDAPADFSGYRPRNFDHGYRGEVSVAEALQLSLNVPAVRLLAATGPRRFLGRLKRAGVDLDFAGEQGTPGLGLALGGAGLTLQQLAGLYTAFPNGGKAQALSLDPAAREAGAAPAAGPMFGEGAAWRVSSVLAGVAPPERAANLPIAYKTGTSWGYRDAFAVGFDGRHVIAVWTGRADAAPVPGMTGISHAAPVLFEAFERSGLPLKPLPTRPSGVIDRKTQDLPFALKKFRPRDAAPMQAANRAAPLEIVYPPQGARVDLANGASDALPLAVKFQGGKPPYRLIANGNPAGTPTRRRNLAWRADGAGASTLTVIDAAGQAVSVSVFLDTATRSRAMRAGRLIAAPQP